jgi:hypothetical protein
MYKLQGKLGFYEKFIDVIDKNPKYQMDGFETEMKTWSAQDKQKAEELTKASSSVALNYRAISRFLSNARLMKSFNYVVGSNSSSKG